MQSVVPDPAAVELFKKVNGLAEVRDAQGRVIGFYAPVHLKHAFAYAQAADRLTAGGDPKEQTTKEVFLRLQSLTSDERLRADLQQRIDRLSEEEGCGTR